MNEAKFNLAKMMYTLQAEANLRETPEEEKWRKRLEYLQRIKSIEVLFQITKEKELQN
jgi:hypothetical protein